MGDSDWENLSLHSSSVLSSNWDLLSYNLSDSEQTEEAEEEKYIRSLNKSEYYSPNHDLPLVTFHLEECYEDSELERRFLLEVEAKHRRGCLFDLEQKNFVNFRGKSRRKKCPCTSCRSALLKSTSQTLSQENEVSYSLKPQERNRSVTYMTDFDVNSKEITQFFVGMERSKREYRDVFVFDLPVTHGIITPQMEMKSQLEEKHILPINRRLNSSGQQSRMKPVVLYPNHYYEFKEMSTGNKLFNFKYNEDHEIASLVRKKTNIGSFHKKLNESLIFNEDREQFIRFDARFISKLTSQETQTDLRYPLFNPKDVCNEISSCSSKRISSTRNYGKCWASTISPSPDYDSWFCELELENRKISGGEYVHALLLQGRSPQIQCFPRTLDFFTMEDFWKYQGPTFPIFQDSRQWVEKIEILAREVSGDWFSLGIFKGNTDSTSIVRIVLPIENMKICFLRIRPLPQSKGGFHGNAPAFKVALIGKKKQVKSSESFTKGQDTVFVDESKRMPTSSVKNIPANHVRLKIKVPPKEKPGIRPKDIYVFGSNQAGLSANSGGTGFYSRGSLTRAKRKKQFQELMKFERLYEER